MTKETKKEPVLLLRVLILILVAVTGYALLALNDASSRYDYVAKTIVSQPFAVASVTIGQKTISIPTYQLFSPGGVWSLVSRDRPLQGEASDTLVTIPVAHGDQQLSMKIAKLISSPLQSLVNAAEADGESLMISSAYRSLDEQRVIRNKFVQTQGEAMADIYVLPVGTSEHHTGLSVDFSSASKQCAADSDSCSLGLSSAQWLEENAARFGFVLRYPEGKQSITGVGYEPWHYRYVGPPLAKAMATTDLTFDEVVTQIAPGYAATR